MGFDWEELNTVVGTASTAVSAIPGVGPMAGLIRFIRSSRCAPGQRRKQMRHSMWIAGTIACSLAWPGAAGAQTLRPFTPVNSVCTTNCTGGPQYDRIVLKDGTEIRARVVAENDSLDVLEKFGELRAVGRDQIQTLDKNPKVERLAGYGDQILLTSGIVLAGTLKNDKNDVDPFELSSGGMNEVAYKSVIAAVYRGGKVVFGGTR